MSATDRTEWEAGRRLGLGGSDMAKAANNIYGGSTAVVASKLGIAADEIDPDLAERGHRWEHPIMIHDRPPIRRPDEYDNPTMAELATAIGIAWKALEPYDWDAIAAGLERLHTIAPIVDPSAYAGSLHNGTLERNQRMVAIARTFVEDMRTVAADVVQARWAQGDTP